MIVKETIRHGDDLHERETHLTTIDGYGPAINALLITSPYCYGAAAPRRLAALVDAFEMTGKFQYGWSDFEMIQP